MVTKAILFDWDGVLIDSTEMYYDIYRKLCHHYSKYLPIKSLQEFRAWYDPAWENNYFQMGFTSDELPMIAEFIAKSVDYSPLSLYPGVAETLKKLSKDYKIAIVSTTPRETILSKLRNEGIDLYINYITGSDGISEKKTKIARTMQILECSKAVMIGDTPLDIASGQANDIPTIGTTYGWVSPERIIASHPTKIIDSSLKLETAIRSLLA